MAREVYYQFKKSGKLLSEGTITAPFTVGRQAENGEPFPVSIAEASPRNAEQPAVSLPKLVVVSLSDRSVPRLFLRVDFDDRGKLVIANTHSSFEFQLANRSIVPAGGRAMLGTEGSLFFAQHYELRLCGTRPTSTLESSITPMNSLAFSALKSPAESPGSRHPQLLTMMEQDPSLSRPDLAIHLVRTVLEAFKAPSGSDEFFSAAGSAAVKMIDLDRVAILFKQAGDWICRAQSFRPETSSAQAGRKPFSRTLLHEMEANSRTTVMEPQLSPGGLAVSMVNVERAVAAPILDRAHKIIGALYGDRAGDGTHADRPIGDLEAAMLDVLASGISSSLVIEEEQRLRSSMSPFFSPVVLAQLASDQKLLDSREADVSVLFCDIRGFSSVTEKIGPTMAINWINDVLTTLSECVLNHDGVLVDYVGDELMAMFGAPAQQPDHAERACRAALEMLSQLEPLGEKWRDVVSSRFSFGIGINSGPASVGNTGSKKKFKYGPLGNTVNLASRVQGITKQLSIPGLITGETAAAIDPNVFLLRRLAKVRVVGIEAPIDIFQLSANKQLVPLFIQYEKALAAYERCDLQQAVGLVAALLQDYPKDRPAIMLLGRTAELLTQTEKEFDPVWSFTQK